VLPTCPPKSILTSPHYRILNIYMPCQYGLLRYWSHGYELPNFCPSTFAQLSVHARRALKRMRQRPTLVMAFWQQARLFPL